jgi:hypothetical protein
MRLRLMSIAWLVAVAAVGAVGCDRRYDPIKETPHLRLPSVGAAVSEVIKQSNRDSRQRPIVFAIGEYHPTTKTQTVTSPETWFYRDMLPPLALVAKHLLLEAWNDDRRWAAAYKTVSKQVTAAIDRPQNASIEFSAVPALEKIKLHYLSIPYVQQQALLDAKGRVDFYRLLLTITEKLAAGAIEISEQAPGESIVVYGGAIHNDLAPIWGLDAFSYTKELARGTNYRVVEIDVVVPEVVKNNLFARQQSWYPLLRAGDDNTAILFQRAKDSYVLITPTHGGRSEPMIQMQPASKAGLD